jgi:hypothetical protein
MVVLITVDHEIYLFPILIFFLARIVLKYFIRMSSISLSDLCHSYAQRCLAAIVEKTKRSNTLLIDSIFKEIKR